MTEPHDIKFYSKAQVSLATFLGALISGALLMRMNYKALGNTKAAQQSLAVGIVGTTILGVLGSDQQKSFTIKGVRRITEIYNA